MIEFFKKPWWVGPIVLGLSFGHPGGVKPSEPTGANGYEKIKKSQALRRNGNAVVIATCPTGKRVVGGGGYIVPSSVGTAELSTTDGNNAWRVQFKSNGGSGTAWAYANCVSVSEDAHQTESKSSKSGRLGG